VYIATLRHHFLLRRSMIWLYINSMKKYLSYHLNYNFFFSSLFVVIVFVFIYIQVHDSYSGFRSSNLDLELSIDVEPPPSNKVSLSCCTLMPTPTFSSRSPNFLSLRSLLLCGVRVLSGVAPA